MTKIEEYEKIYDEVEEAVKGWSHQTKEDVLINILCLYVSTAKNKNKEVSNHPFVIRITDGDMD